MRTALTIAGSDSSGGAGIQADIKTMTANGVFAMSAVTALTAQNTTGVSGIMDVSPEFLGEQLDRVFEDIFPDAVKIGMVSSTDLIRMIASKLKEYKAVNIVLLGRLSHYFDAPEDAWQASLEAIVPPKFLELNKKAFELGRGN